MGDPLQHGHQCMSYFKQALLPRHHTAYARAPSLLQEAPSGRQVSGDVGSAKIELAVQSRVSECRTMFIYMMFVVTLLLMVLQYVIETNGD